MQEQYATFPASIHVEKLGNRRRRDNLKAKAPGGSVWVEEVALDLRAIPPTVRRPLSFWGASRALHLTAVPRMVLKWSG